MTTLRLAMSGGASTRFDINRQPAPAILVSYAWRERYLDENRRIPLVYRDWACDSGAFTVHTQGGTIDLGAYIEFCLTQKALDPTLAEIFALDVIDKPEESLRNTERMWREGVEAIPTFHSGEPWSVLEHIAKHYPKIAIGGAVGMPVRAKREWAEQCFARVYPKPIHGLGFGSQEHLFALPFHSADATNWQYPQRFGLWAGYSDPFRQAGRALLTVRGAPCMRVEVDWHLRLERYLKDYWRAEMTRLDAMLTERHADHHATV